MFGHWLDFGVRQGLVDAWPWRLLVSHSGGQESFFLPYEPERPRRPPRSDDAEAIEVGRLETVRSLDTEGDARARFGERHDDGQPEDERAWLSPNLRVLPGLAGSGEAVAMVVLCFCVTRVEEREREPKQRDKQRRATRVCCAASEGEAEEGARERRGRKRTETDGSVYWV